MISVLLASFLASLLAAAPAKPSPKPAAPPPAPSAPAPVAVVQAEAPSPAPVAVKPPAAASQLHQPIRLALPALAGPRLEDSEAEFYAEDLAQKLTARGLLVTTSKQIATVLGLERQKQLVGCSEDGVSCMAELANALGVDGVVSGEIARLEGGLFQVNLKVLSPTDGRVLASFAGKADNEQALLDTLVWASATLSSDLGRSLKRILPPPTAEALASEESALRPLRRKAWIPAVASVGLAAAGGFFYLQSSQRYEQIKRPSGGTLFTSEVNRLRSEGEQFQLFAGASAVLATASLATAATLYFITSSRPEPAQSISIGAGASPAGAGLSVGGTF